MANRRLGRRAEAQAAKEAAQQMQQNGGAVLTEGVRQPTSGGEKVVVACKLGVAWFDLQGFEKKTVTENTQVGPRTIEQFVRLPDVVRIRGTAYPRGTPPTGYPERPEMYEGYALTRGVDRDFFERWMELNKKAPYVVNGLIFGGTEDQVRGHARELRGRLSGLEPLDPDAKDARIPKPTNAAVSVLEGGTRN